jgi:hypothetical protein
MTTKRKGLALIKASTFQRYVKAELAKRPHLIYKRVAWCKFLRLLEGMIQSEIEYALSVEQPGIQNHPFKPNKLQEGRYHAIQSQQTRKATPVS